MNVPIKHLCTATTNLQCGVLRCTFYEDHVVTGIPHRGAITWGIKVQYGYKDPWVEWACTPVAVAQAGKQA